MTKHPISPILSYSLIRECHYCDKLEITIAQLDNIEMNFLTSAQLVEAGVKVSSDKQGIIKLNTKRR